MRAYKALSSDLLTETAAKTNPGTIVFCGSPLLFSDWILRVAAEESGNMRIVRMPSLAEADLSGLAATRDLRGVFLDAAEADRQTIDACRAAIGGVPLVLAYRDTALGHRILAQRQEREQANDLQLIPMNVPIDVWTPLFRLALTGNVFVPGDLLANAPEPGDDRPQHRAGAVEQEKCGINALTAREKEVLSLVSEGQGNKTIAYELGLSEHTIKLHLHHIIRKIGVHNRTAAASWYLSRHFGAHQNG